MGLKSTIIANLKNLPGKKTNRKLVVIFADDYGSIRMRDRGAYHNLLDAGIAVDKTRYGFDTICTTDDLQRLFEVLTSVKDKNGHYACFTPFANIANPDFEKIKESGFEKYYREPFTETMQRLGKAYDGAYELWKQGIAETIFCPEYHGTEHICVRRFMKALLECHKSTMLAFENGSVCCPSLPNETPIHNSTTTFDIEHASDNESLKDDIRVGLAMFEELIGYRSSQFTPGASIYSPALHPTLKECGVNTIHVNRYKAYPLGDGKCVKKFLYNGKRNECGQHYLVRNCPFEPFFDNCAEKTNVVATCLKNVESAFNMHAPALISTHRVNFAGAIETTHRDKSLEQLGILLKEIVKRWPDAEFVSGRQLTDIMF